MSIDASLPEPDPTQANALQARLEAAARERLYVDDPGIPGMLHVYSTVGRKHIVDVESGSCTCEDYHYRGEDLGFCKHMLRIMLERADLEIPPVRNPDPLLLERRGEPIGE